MRPYLRKAAKTCELLLNASKTDVFVIDDYKIAECGYKTSNTPPADEEFIGTEIVRGLDKHYWLKTSFKTPIKEKDCDFFLEVTTGESGWNGSDPQFLVYLNGKMEQGLDTNHHLNLLEPDKSYDLVTYVYNGYTKCNKYDLTHKIVKINRRVEKLYYDLLIPYETCRDVYGETSDEYAKTLGILDRACNLVDLRQPNSEAFFKSIEDALSFIEEEYYGKLCTTEGKPVVNCVGSTHIDVEWLWDRLQTKEKIQRSASTAIKLMSEYPEYKFMLSQPNLYQYLKEEAPEKYAELKELVKEGRIEPEGAMYVECDCNLTGGESFVRQLIQGKKFFRDEFGKESKILYLPDVFGYSAALPQILKKSGVDYFVTSKISWNDTNMLPYDVFLWQGIDGTEIFASFIMGQDYKKGLAPDTFTGYNGTMDPKWIYGTWNRLQQKEFCSTALNTYGYGDGGGGPTREMLEKQRRLAKGLPAMPVTKMISLTSHLEDLKAEFDENTAKLRRTPKWVGELYLEYHRGTYTSQAATKRGNRKSELALIKSESLSATDLYFGGSYDKEGLYENWTKVLHNQFHDILPGSSIHSVYEFTKQDYADIKEYTDRVIDEKLDAIAKRIDTEGGVLVYNALGHERAGSFTLDGKTYYTGEKIPAVGYAVISAEEPTCSVKLDTLTAENDFYRVTFDKAGRITSLFDKENDREIVKPGAVINELQAFEDNPYMYDAWEMEEYMQTKPYIFDTDATVTPVYDGERAGFTFERKYQSSTIKQTVWLYSHSRRIDFDHDIDWQDNHQVLKLAFPIDVYATSAKFDIQFGHTSRPTHRNTSWDTAKFEVCAHKWVDISENGYGVALLNDCKYGFSVEESTIKLTCLKSATNPDETADIGKHTFTCSLLPHAGSLTEGGVIDEAYALNQPLEAKRISATSGTAPSKFSLVEAKEEAVVIEAVKCAEDGTGDVIVRFYEAFGGKIKAHIAVADEFTGAFLCTPMEDVIESLPINADGTVTVPLHQFEIGTIRLKK